MAGVAAIAILVSLQVGRHSLCSSHTSDVLTLHFTTHTSAPSQGFRLVLPLNRQKRIFTAYSFSEKRIQAPEFVVANRSETIR
ncbi:hypothetical protein Y032_0007g3349 [Ancylostoma ceylanicum]|uniref:Uncharacterized protein n=1 Tax=Ancylostoma ceylanicum TaxID=53326 RepID=A0A016VMY8_9BILA|nr:hypothetical protein Y032_0007g3349 [Ancylostoma ceylanicum]